MKRNIVTEITEIKERSDFNSRHDYSHNLEKIELAFEDILRGNGDYNEELLKYIPIATVSCFEAFFRSIIKEIIDFGAPFRNNLKSFNQTNNMRFDFDIVGAIEKKNFTMGEFVSHILKCNNLEEINLNLTTIIGKDFLSSIKEFQNPTRLQDESTYFNKNFNQILSDVKRTFELRHIFCHEFATNTIIDRDEIFRCFKNSTLFLQHTNEFVWNLLYPNAPLTQSEMNAKSAEDFQLAEERFLELIEKIKKIAQGNSFVVLNEKLFSTAVDQWKSYRDAWAKSMSFGYNGGTIYSTIYHYALIKITNEKIESLKSDFEFDLKKSKI